MGAKFNVTCGWLGINETREGLNATKVAEAVIAERELVGADFAEADPDYAMVIFRGQEWDNGDFDFADFTVEMVRPSPAEELASLRTDLARILVRMAELEARL
jgi:hypothetical protein